MTSGNEPSLQPSLQTAAGDDLVRLIHETAPHSHFIALFD